MYDIKNYKIQMNKCKRHISSQLKANSIQYNFTIAMAGQCVPTKVCNKVALSEAKCRFKCPSSW